MVKGCYPSHHPQILSTETMLGCKFSKLFEKFSTNKEAKNNSMKSLWQKVNINLIFEKDLH